MAKLIVQHEEDPGIAMVLEYTATGTPGRARGWYGKCTQCGWPIHRWVQGKAVEDAQAHVDGHESHL